jgi:hypothetical protein
MAFLVWETIRAVTINEKVQALLAAAGGVTALVSSDKIKPPGEWSNLSSPYIIHFPVTFEPLHVYGGLSSKGQWTYQVSVFAASASSARAVADAVCTALDGTHTISGWSLTALITAEHTLPMEADTGIHHVAVEFEVFTSLS